MVGPGTACAGGALGGGDVRPRPLPAGGADGYDTSEGGGGGGTAVMLWEVGCDLDVESARGLCRPFIPDCPDPVTVAELSVLGRPFAVTLLSPRCPVGLSLVGEGANVDGGGAVGASYESTETIVCAGDNGAPSGPINRTFFFSPSFPLPVPINVADRSEDSVEGAMSGRLKRFSPSSESANPGVATVDHAPLPVEYVL